MINNSASGYSVGSVENWYKQFPYTFEWKISDDATKIRHFNLPIAPQNIQITTHFATNVVATMYGTIEEHSEQRYFDIVISGTTGMTPKYFAEYRKRGNQGQSEELNRQLGIGGFYTGVGRAKYSAATPILGAASSFFRKTQELLSKARNELFEVFQNENRAIDSGVNNNQTGYVAFHNFYNFLLEYKKNVSSGNKPAQGHPLSFINYKDNNKYDVSITNFTLVRDYKNPMLYNYSISMRAYNLRDADSSYSGFQLDLVDLGLTGVQTSLFAKASNKVRKVKNAAYAAIAAVRSAGL